MSPLVFPKARSMPPLHLMAHMSTSKPMLWAPPRFSHVSVQDGYIVGIGPCLVPSCVSIASLRKYADVFPGKPPTPVQGCLWQCIDGKGCARSPRL